MKHGKYWLLVAAAVALGVAGHTSTANASGCSIRSSQWKQTITCGGGKAKATGAQDSNGTKTLFVQILTSGNADEAAAQGINSKGKLISTCYVHDDTDSGGKYDKSGCAAGVKFALAAGYD
jgi:hypothetical protein